LVLFSTPEPFGPGKYQLRYGETVAGLVLGQKYIISLSRGQGFGKQVATIEPSAVDVLELGAFRVDSSGNVTRDVSKP
jgi:hypothetical protein